MTATGENIERLKFGQREPLTTRLHGLVRSYPKGVGIIQEFLQNADDAGASELWVILDESDYSKELLPNSEMELLQGPSLFIFNDACFTEEDVARVQQIGDSGKILDTSKTGRFGLGFNAVYNVTDWPGLLTGDQIGYFDPHEETIKGAGGDSPGAAWRLGDALWKKWPHLLEPFAVVGLQPGANHYAHTAFRLPLRDEEQARRSKISDQAFSVRDFERIVEKLQDHIADLLLFLKNVLSIRISRILPNGHQEELLHVKTVNNEEVEASRQCLRTKLSVDNKALLQTLRDAEDEESVWEWTHIVEISGSGLKTCRETWEVVHGLFSDDDAELIDAATTMFHFGEKAIPLAGAAAPAPGQDIERSTGQLYCGLPIPTSSYAPFHVQGFFDLQSDRQGIFEDSGAEGKDAARVRWNELLLVHACAPAAARLLVRLGHAEANQGKLAYARWPQILDDAQTIVQKLPKYVYEHLIEYPCLAGGSDATWHKPEDIRIVPKGATAIIPSLLAEGVSIPKPRIPSRIIKGFDAVGKALTVLTPADVREHYRVEEDPACEIAESVQPGLRKRKWVVELLRFVVVDGDFDDLCGVPFAITADGYLHAFDLMVDSPIFLAGEKERELFSAHPEWFIDQELQAALRESDNAGIKEMTALDAVKRIPLLVSCLAEGESVCWDDSQPGIPTAGWLCLLYKYLADHSKDLDLSGEQFENLPLVPDQFGNLWSLGYAKTPLLPSQGKEQRHLVEALRPFRAPIVDAKRELLDEIRRFEGVYRNQQIWGVSGLDLIDTLHAVREDWDESTAKYTRDVHGRILDFLSTSTVIAGLQKDYPDRVDKLRELPIARTVGGELVGLGEADIYLPGDYQLPPVAGAIRLLDVGLEGHWAKLYEVAKVPILTRAALIQKVLIPAYEEMTAKEQTHALRWIRTELAQAQDELERISDDAAETLLELMRTRALVRCTDGKLRSASSIYNPNAEFIGELLGSFVGYPDLEHYGDNPVRWLQFFEQLGMVQIPRPEDIVRAIDLVCSDVDENTWASCVEMLEQIVRYLAQHWDDLRDAQVKDDPNAADSDNWNLTDALSSRAWLPAVLEPPAKFPVALFRAPEAHFYKPADLHNRDSLDLVGGVAPVCALTDVQPRLRQDLGMVSNPSLENVLRHFEQVLKQCVDERLPEQQGFRTGQILHRIYGYFGSEIYTEADGEQSAAFLGNRYEERPCIVDENGCLWRPKHVFTEAVPYFLGRRVHLQARRSDIVRGYLALGQRDAPGRADYAEFFQDLAIELAGQPVDSDSLQDLRLAYVLAASESCEDPYENVSVLASDGVLHSPGDLVLDDAPWLSERARRANIEMLDVELGVSVARAFGIIALSQAVYEVASEMDHDTDPRFAETCNEVQTAFRSKEFQCGVERLMRHFGHRPRAADLEWLGNVSVVAVRRLRTGLVWWESRESIPGSEGDSDVLFDPTQCELIVSMDADGVLFERLADALNHEFERDGYDLDDLSCLVAIMREKPSRIDQLLTRLRVSKTEETQIEDIGTADETGYVDEKFNSVGDGEGEPENGTPPETDARKPLPASDIADGEASIDVESSTRKSDTGEAQGEPSLEDRPGGAGAETREPNKAGTGQSSSRDLGVRDTPAQSEEEHREGTKTPKPSPGRSRSRSTPAHSRRARTYVHSGSRTSDQNAEGGDDGHRTSVDEAAIARVLEFEKEHGRVPENMPHNNPGYDVESKNKGGDVERYIEVKGLSGPWSDYGVGLSSTQHGYGQRKAEQFWLYVVEFALDASRARLYAIRNPIDIVDEYRFDGDWKKLCTETNETRADPQVGDRIVIGGKREGVVEKIHERGKLKRLHIRYDDGETKAIVYNATRMRIVEEEGE